MKPAKKLYRVVIGAIEDGAEFNHFDSKKVIATDAMHAASRVRLRKTDRVQTFIESIEKISEIDKL